MYGDFHFGNVHFGDLMKGQIPPTRCADLPPQPDLPTPPYDKATQELYNVCAECPQPLGRGCECTKRGAAQTRDPSEAEVSAAPAPHHLQPESAEAREDMRHALTGLPAGRAGESQAASWQAFACYLIDHCKGETVSEEAVQRWSAKMLEIPQYRGPQRKAPR